MTNSAPDASRVDTPPTPPHTLTILQSRACLLAKRWLADGTIADYDRAKQFTATPHRLGGITELHTLLASLARQPSVGVIRGRSLAPQTGATTRRTLVTTADEPSHLLVLDLDKVAPEQLGGIDPLDDPEAAIEHYVLHHLPRCLHGVTVSYHLSGSMGHPTRARTLRCHLRYWLAEPLTCNQAERWVKAHCPQVDHTVCRPVQLNYTADPTRGAGAPVDPLAGRRSGLITGVLADVVTLDTYHVPEPEVLRDGVVVGQRQMLDPRTKPGLLGAVCRAFTPYQLPELFPDVWATGSTPRRITWLGGGGTPEGCVVTDDQLHLFNAHASSPAAHAVNVFDAVRLHVHGHLDAGHDPDALALAPTAAPSYVATAAWASAQAEVQAELAGPEGAAGQAEAERTEARTEARAEKALSDAEERAGRMQRVLAKVAKADLDKLELDLCRQAARIDWTAGEREQLAIAVQARTKALLPPRGMPITAVRAWLVKQHADPNAAFAHRAENGAPLATVENLAALFAQRGWSHRYNVISRRPEIRGTGATQGGDNEDNVALGLVQSACSEVGMPMGTALLTSYLTVLCGAGAYNPVQEWVDSKPWDGTPRVAKLLGTLTLAEYTDPVLMHKLLRKWLVQAVAGALSPEPLQLRGVLSLPGGQFAGKTRWFQRLAGEHANSLVLTGRLIDPRNKDSKITAARYWICELGELDATLSTKHAGELKGYISQDMDVERVPYAATDSKLQRRTSFVASVNHEQFLVDESGNTRFWVIPITAVDPDHQVDMQQVWAEVAQAWRGGEAHYFLREEMLEISSSSERHQVVNPVHQAIADRFDWPEAGVKVDMDSWPMLSAVQVLRLCGVKNPTLSHMVTAGIALQKLGAGRCPRTAKGNRWRVPCAVSDFSDSSE